MGDERLVRGDDMLAVLQRGRDQLARHALAAADQLDHDIGIAPRQRRRVGLPAHAAEIEAAVARSVARRHGDQLELAPGAPLQQLGILPQQPHRAGADRAEPGNRDFERRLHGGETSTGSLVRPSTTRSSPAPPRMRTIL